MVIIPNENDYTKLSLLQKKICKLLRDSKKEDIDKLYNNFENPLSKDTFFIPFNPLWFYIEDEKLQAKSQSKNELKTFAKEINKIILTSFDFFGQWNNYHSLSIKGKLYRENIENNLTCNFILTNLKEFSTKEKEIIEKESQSIFPLQLKIFRLAVDEEKQLKENGEMEMQNARLWTEIENFVWKKNV